MFNNFRHFEIISNRHKLKFQYKNSFESQYLYFKGLFQCNFKIKMKSTSNNNEGVHNGTKLPTENNCEDRITQ